MEPVALLPDQCHGRRQVVGMSGRSRLTRAEARLYLLVAALWILVFGMLR